MIQVTKQELANFIRKKGDNPINFNELSGSDSCGCDNGSPITTYNVEVQNGDSVEKFTIKSRGAPSSYYNEYDLIIKGSGTNEVRRFIGPKVKSITEENVLGEVQVPFN